MKFIRSKLLPILCAIVFLLFSTNDFGLVNIERTAIIMAIGIDYEKEKQEYEVTAQIAIPQPSTTASPENNDSLISEKGKTIAEAIDKIGINTGWYPMLSFCNLVLLGKSLMELNIMETINYFIRTDKIQDSAHIAGCEESAKDTLSSSTPLDSVSSFTIQKILGKDIAKLDRIADTSIKDFSQQYYSKSKSGFMPLIKKIKIEQSAGGGSSGEGSSGGSGGSSSKQGKDQYVFDASTTLIFKEGFFVETLTPEETLFFNIEHKNSLDTFLSLDEVEIDGKKTSVMLGINEFSKKYRLKMIDGKPVYCIDLIFFCKYEDANVHTEVNELNPTAQIPKSVLTKAEEKITKTINGLFEKLKKSNCDIFMITDQTYKFHYKEYQKYGDGIFELVELSTKVDCQTEKSTRL
ncbi:MAG: hypothetical protein E7360_04095 [Clostridiales bacterium]|nr:hypothetical protein [Clostridiales bacterium]